MVDPSKKVVGIELLRIERNMKKICSCENPLYDVDVNNRAVWCRICGAWIDPFEAILYIARYPEKYIEDCNKVEAKYSELVERHNELVVQVNELANKRPRLRLFRSLEQSYQKGKMLPHCPKCDQVFRFEKIVGWTNENYVEEDTKEE
jgi:hypothetical protein